MEFIEQEIARIEASIEYDEVDTFIMENSIDAITKAGYNQEAIVPLLQLLERHPITYFGDPGAIVHFIEHFNPEYEEYLVESLKRTPTITTIWMLNRCINGREHAEELIALMKEIGDRTDVDQEIRERAQIWHSRALL